MRTNGNVSWLVKAVHPTGKETVKAMGERVVDMQFSLPVYVDFMLNDFIVLDNETYKINLTPTVEKKAKRLYDYTIQFEHEFYDLAKIQIQGLNPQNGYLEPSFSVTGNALTIITLIVENINRAYPGWTVGVIDETEYKNFTFSAQNCLQALNQLASDYKTEFWIENKTIHLQKREQSSGLTFAYGQGKGLYNILRQNKTSTNIITRLYVRGSSENLPIGYRDYAGNLLLPGGLTYIQDDSKVDLYGLIEGTQNFEIKPEREGTITSVVSGDGNWKYFTDTSMDFNLNDYKLSDPVKITFNTGQLAGYTFTLSSYNNSTKTFTINKNDEEKSIEVPSNLLRPAVGDKYVILNIQMPPLYVTDGENRLLNAGQTYYDQNSDPKFLLAYSAKCDRLFIKQNQIEVQLGNTAIINDPDMGLNTEVRIASYTRDLQDRNLYDEVEWADTIGPNEIVRQYAQQQRTLKLIESSGLLSSDQLRKNIFLNRLSELNGYLMLAGNKVKAGVADFATDAARAALADYATDSDKWDGKQFADYLDQPVRKTDAVKFASVEADTLNSKVYVSGFTGVGYKINPDGSAEFDSITIRKDLNVNVLNIREITGTGGSLAITNVAKIKEVNDGGSFWSCIINTDDGSIAVPFKANDIIRCQVWDGKKLKYYSARVRGVSASIFDLEKSSFVGSGIPQPGDTVFQFGNVTDASRQGLIYLTNSDSGAPYLDVLDGINSADLTGKTKVRLGKLNGINDPDFGALQGYGLYGENVYLKNGKFKGEVTITGGNAATQAYANTVANNALDVVISNGKVRTPLLDSDDIRAITAKIDYLNGLEFNFTQGTIDRLKARVINAAQIISDGGGATLSYVNNQITTATTQASADATVKASAAQVAAIQVAANDASAKVSAIQLGGRNLLPDSSFENGVLLPVNLSGLEASILSDGVLDGGLTHPYLGTKSLYLAGNNVTSAGDIYVYLNKAVKFIPGETYTISFYYVGAGSITGCSTYINFNATGHKSVGFTLFGDKVWRRLTYSFVCDPADTSGEIRFGFHATGFGWMAFDAIKVEKGNKVSDWTPAPEDGDFVASQKADAAQLAATNAAYAQAAYEREIAKAYADGKVTAEEQSRIAQAQANLQTAKDDAQQKVTAALGAANGYTDTKNQQTLAAAQSYADASAQSKANVAQANAISQASTDAQAKANAAQAAAAALSQQLVDGLKFGGRNYLSGTSTGISLNGYTGKGKSLSIPLVNGELYTLSWRIKNISNSPNVLAYTSIGIGGDTRQNLMWINNSKPSDSFTFIANSNGSQATVITFWNEVYGYPNNPSIDIYDVKLEKGNKATDWTPAPEDVQAAIDNAKALADQANASYTTLTANLKSLAYADVVEAAKLGTTVIEGGKIKANLLDVDYIKVNVINADYIKSLNIVATNIEATTGTIGGWSLASDRIFSGSESSNYIALKSGSSPELYMKNSSQAAGEYSSINTKGLFILSTGNALPTPYGSFNAVGAFKLKPTGGSSNSVALYVSALTGQNLAFYCDGDFFFSGVGTFKDVAIFDNRLVVNTGNVTVSNIPNAFDLGGTSAPLKIITSGGNRGRLCV